MAFVLAGIVAALSLGLGFLGLMASSMSDAPGQTSGVAPYVVGGLAPPAARMTISPQRSVSRD